MLILASVIMLCYLTTSAVYATSTQDKLNQAQEDKKQTQSQLNETKENLVGLQEEKNSLEGKLADLNEKLTVVSNNLNDLEKQISDKEVEIEITEEELEEAKETEEYQYESMKTRIRFMYERSDYALLETLLGSGSLAEALNKADYVEQVAAYDIVIRNGRLAGVYAENPKTTEMQFYNLYRDGKITKTDDMLKYMTTQGDNGAYLLYNDHRDIAEAILNMNLVEFATTFANQSDVSVTTEWDTYKGWGIYEDNNRKSVVEEVKEATNLYAASDSNRTEGTWYGEDSTVFRIVKFTTEAAIPAEIGLTYKIPATYGYKSTANRGGIFSDKSKVAFGWLEVGFKLGNSVKPDSRIAKVTDNSGKNAYSSAWFDIIGNELIGSDVQIINPVYQFIISDGSVTNMHN